MHDARAHGGAGAGPGHDPSALLEETLAARTKAERLLEGLLSVKETSERRLHELRQWDALARVTGRSSIDNAIESTRAMIELIDRSLADLRWAMESRGLGPMAG